MDLVGQDFIFGSVFAFLWLEFAWELYLSIRQLRVLKATEKPPAELEAYFEEATFAKSRLYGLDKSSYGITHSIFKQIFTSVLIYINSYAYFWSLSGSLLAALNLWPDSEVQRSMTFTMLVSLFSMITDMPFTVYYTFWLEERHGFNKQTPSFFIKDTLKSVALQFVLLPLVGAVVYIVQVGGDYFFVYLWAFATVVLLVLMTVYPDYIAPLFDKYSPLREGPLRTQIEELAASINFPLTKIYVFEGSKRSAHSNAYLYGFFNNKRIVLFDTLIQGYVPESSADKSPDSNCDGDSGVAAPLTSTKGCNDDEILAVLAHELGHWKLSHVTKNLILSEVNILVTFLVFNLLFKYEPLYAAFGFHDSKPILIGLTLVTSYIFSPYNTLVSFLMTLLSRRFEFEADAFAKRLNRADKLKSALVKLNVDNLGFPVYDEWYSRWHHSHPTLLQRLDALDKTD